MKRFLAIALLISLPAWAEPAHPEDAAFLAARDAYAKGDRARLSRAAAGLSTHPLTPWANYFQLSLQLRDGKDSSDAGVAALVERHAGTWLAEKLRGEWLKWLLDQQDWARAREQFARLQRPDADAVCRGLDARLNLGEPGVLTEARALLVSPQPLAGSCFPPLARLAASGEVSGADIWERLRRQWALGKLKEARAVAGWLPADEAPVWKAVDAIVEHPAQHLARLPERFADSRRGRELAGLAVLRMARADARVAAARWQELESRIPVEERGFVWGRLALAAAMTHQPEATAWFGRAEKLGATLDEEQHAWRIRAALRAGDWLGVTRAIAMLPEAMAAQPEWIYWRGRAIAALGKPEDAVGIYQPIAGQANFYGILAAEALGRPLALPPRALPPNAEERLAAETNTALVRGLALIRADLRLDGLREWNWALTGMDDRQLLAAADFAQRNDVIDRAINTADRTQAEHDFVQRYPTPYFAQVEPRARNVALDPAWVYGLMRQESRFIMDAKSSAGAKGLMQLMPATAKWVAHKIGMDNYHPGRVTDMDTNVTLGTNYMRMVMDGLDSHPLLASAAYNAGPGRARKWRAETPLEGAIYAETIPFSETRDYVKKVMANAMHYAAVMGPTTTPTPTLTQRLGTIRPRGFGDTTAESLP
jgi:soluble lytic murein transglycosylase